AIFLPKQPTKLSSMVWLVSFVPCRWLWKSWAPRNALFIWLAIYNRCWTANRLARRGLPRPSQCPLCDMVLCITERTRLGYSCGWCCICLLTLGIWVMLVTSRFIALKFVQQCYHGALAIGLKRTSETANSPMRTLDELLLPKLGEIRDGVIRWAPLFKDITELIMEQATSNVMADE
ncbi:hypothetical protein E2562_026786, partial [Oryza meyeriana var. granulata]